MQPSFGICGAVRWEGEGQMQQQVWYDTHTSLPALHWSLATRSLQSDVRLSSLGCPVTEQRGQLHRTRRKTWQVTFASFPVAGVQHRTQLCNTSGEEMVRFRKRVWTVLRKLYSCINSTSNISYEHHKVQDFLTLKTQQTLKILIFIHMSSLFNSGSHWQEQSQISSYIFSSDCGLCNAGFESSTHYVITDKDNDCCSKLSRVPSPWLTFKPNKLFSTVCGILYKKLTFSRSESSKQPEAHAPSQNFVYLT